MPWDDARRASLIAHIGELDWLVPGLISVTGKDHHITVFPDHPLEALLAATPKPPAIVPMVQNIIDGKWDGQGMAALLHDPQASAKLLSDLEPQLEKQNAIGVMFDFEELPASAQGDYIHFLAQARQRYANHYWQVTLAVPVDNKDWDLGAYAQVADKLVLMEYDEHTNDAEPGPIASQAWFVSHLKSALTVVPRSKAIVGIGSYSYDWSGAGKGDTGSIEDAWLTAHDSNANIMFDKVSGNPTFGYEENGDKHTVWFLDAASAWNELSAVNLKAWPVSHSGGLARRIKGFGRPWAPISQEKCLIFMSSTRRARLILKVAARYSGSKRRPQPVLGHSFVPMTASLPMSNITRFQLLMLSAAWAIRKGKLRSHLMMGLTPNGRRQSSTY